MIDDVQMRRDSYPTASVLFGVAALQCLTGLLGLFVRLTNPDIDMPELRWFLYGFQRGDSTWLDWVTLSTVGLYLVLGFGAYAFRVPAALLAFASYCHPAGHYAVFRRDSPK